MRVACCGLTTLDLIQVVDRLPGPDEKVQARSARLEFGGPAANAAFTAVALGAAATLVSAVGSEDVGRVAAAQIRDAGIDLVDAAGPGWQVPVSAVSVVGSHRSVISRNAADGGSGACGRPAAISAGALNDVAAVLVDGHHLDLCLAVAALARARGIPVLLDGGSWKPGLERLLDLVDAAVLSADFRAPAAIDWGARPVAVSRGPQPILLAGEEIAVPQVDVVDTVGAGDVLHGALLVHVGEHGLASFAEGLRRAAVIASMSCGYPGAHGWARRRVTTKR